MSPSNCPLCMSSVRVEDDSAINRSSPRYRVVCNSPVCRFTGRWEYERDNAIRLWNLLGGRGRDNRYSDTLNRTVDMLKSRESLGVNKYGCTVDRRDQPVEFWVRMAIEEVLDLSQYLLRLLEDIEKASEKNVVKVVDNDPELT